MAKRIVHGAIFALVALLPAQSPSVTLTIERSKSKLVSALDRPAIYIGGLKVGSLPHEGSTLTVQVVAGQQVTVEVRDWAGTRADAAVTCSTGAACVVDVSPRIMGGWKLRQE